MKFLKTLSILLPWLIYAAASSIFPSYAMMVGLISCLFSYSKLRKGFILEWGSLLLFFAGIISHVVGTQWLIQHLSILMSLFFIAAAGISLLIGRPFTMQYAKLEMDQKVWNHPLFLRINQIMTGIFGIIFLGVALVNLYRYFHPGILNGWIVWSIAILVKIALINKFPNWYKKRYLQKMSDENYSN